MKIGVITYNVPHKKTQDVLFRLKAGGWDWVECITLPFIPRKKWVPLIRHRMVNELPVQLNVFCQRMGFTCTERIDLAKYDKIIVGGSNILSKETIGNHEIINSHPGYLPYVRGLDSLKWAILDGRPIGVTTHVIDESIDGGTMIDRQVIPIEYFDTIHSLGYKTYQRELDMLIEALTKETRIRLGPGNPPKRRMPHSKEVQMLAKLEKLKMNTL